MVKKNKIYKRNWLTRNFYDWYMDVRIIDGVSSLIYQAFFMILLNLMFMGFQFKLFDGYFEYLVIASLLIMIFQRWDIKFSDSTNGFFSLSNWIIGIFFIIGAMTKNYTLFYTGYRFFGALFAVYIIMWCLPYIILKKSNNVKRLSK